ncbi:phosphate-starvation-inducible PsiE family protein, partial [Klebsiella pneumoniae]|uniref:phosphate-starvation-inducible PsiE family protein n=1 Tax=Klebsiella pneumoniae TaxID=573 RepID=UPI00272F9892
LRDDVIHVKLVVATALMAIARKVIVLDLSTLEPAYLYAIGVIVLAFGMTYWLVSAKTDSA